MGVAQYQNDEWSLSQDCFMASIFPMVLGLCWIVCRTQTLQGLEAALLQTVISSRADTMTKKYVCLCELEVVGKA